jgi:hypothetical protein
MFRVSKLPSNITDCEKQLAHHFGTRLRAYQPFWYRPIVENCLVIQIGSSQNEIRK